MNCDLKILDSLILNNLNPVNFKEEQSGDNFAEWLTIAEEFKKKYQSGFLAETFTLHDERLIKQHIQCHQERLIFLSDRLYHFINLHDNTSKKYSVPPLSFLEIQQSIYCILEELLFFLEDGFPKHFKFLDPVPKKMVQSTKEEFGNSLQVIKNQLTNNQSKLWEIALQPFEEFIKNERKSINYREIEYCRNLLEELEALPGSNLFERDDGLLKNILFRYNFNSWHFFYYLTDEINSSVQNEETLTAQLEKYYWHQKVINQSFIKPGVILYHKRLSIKDSLSDWISEEIIYLEKRYQLLQPSNDLLKEPVLNNLKVSTDLSVSQFAFLIKLLSETGLMKNKNTKELLRFYSKHIQTKRVLNISADSLYSKFYNVSDSDKQAVKTYIIKMLNQLNSKTVLLFPLILYFLDLVTDLDNALVLQYIF